MEEGKLRLHRNGDSFVLERKTSGGCINCIELSKLDLLMLAQSAQALQSWMTSRLVPDGSGSRPVFSTKVTTMDVRPDALMEAIYLTLAAPSGQQTVYSLSLPMAAEATTQLNKLLHDLKLSRWRPE